MTDRQEPFYIPVFRSVAQSIAAMHESGNDHEIVELVIGAFRYFFDGGQEPDFSHLTLAQIAWINAKPIIEKSIQKSLNMKRQGNKNAQKNANETQKNAKKRNGSELRLNCDYKEKEKEMEMDIKENTKENAPLFSLNDTGSIHQSAMLPEQTPFTKWTPEQFTRSVDEVIGQFPDYAPYKAEFVDFWSETDSKGKMRFQREKTWETSKRLHRWHNRAADRARPSAAPYQEPLTSAQIVAEFKNNQ